MFDESYRIINPSPTFKECAIIRGIRRQTLRVGYDSSKWTACEVTEYQNNRTR